MFINLTLKNFSKLAETIWYFLSVTWYETEAAWLSNSSGWDC